MEIKKNKIGREGIYLDSAVATSGRGIWYLVFGIWLNVALCGALFGA
jgi:uncharacterized membrane protein YccF (DUF307 family)